MYIRLVHASVAIGLLGVQVGCSGRPADERDIERTAGDSIIYIDSAATDYMDVTTHLVGTGFVIDKQGHAITAKHVVPAPDVAEGTTVAPLPSDSSGYKSVESLARTGLTQRTYTIRVLQRSEVYDFALLQLEGEGLPTPVSLGDPQEPKRYDQLFAGGFPGGEDLDVVRGTLRHTLSQAGEGQWHTDLPVTTGDSGGPVFYNGNVVAMVEGGITGSTVNQYVLSLSWVSPIFARIGIGAEWSGRETYLRSLRDRDIQLTQMPITDEPLRRKAREFEIGEVKRRLANSEDALERQEIRIRALGNFLAEVESRVSPESLRSARSQLENGSTREATDLLASLGVSQNDLAARVHFNLGRIAEGDVRFVDALESYRSAARGAPYNALYLESAGRVAGLLDRADEAIAFLDEAVNLRHARFGTGDPEYAASLCRLGDTYLLTDESQRTVELCSDTIKLLSGVTSRELDVAFAHNTRGGAYAEQAKYAAAEKEFKTAIRLFARATPGGEWFATASSNLGGLYRRMGRYREAKVLLQRALVVGERVLGPGHPELAPYVGNLSSSELALAEYAEAEEGFRRGVKLIERSYGPKHLVMTRIVRRLAVLRSIENQAKEAVELGENALRMQIDLVGPDSLSVAETRWLLAAVLSEDNQLARAEEQLRTARKALRAQSPPDGRLVGLNITYADVLRKKGELGAALERCNEAEEFSRLALDASHPLIAELAFERAQVLIKQGQRRSALRSLESALAIYLTRLPEIHPKIARVYRSMGEIYEKEGARARARLFVSRAEWIMSEFAGIRQMIAADL